MRTCPAVPLGLAAAALGYGVLFHLGRTSGSTPDERAAGLPGDDLVADANVRTDHAVTIGAPAARVWPWLTQMGWHRGGWYTPRWVDRLLFPDNWPSADHLDPALLRDLQAGDTVPDGPPGTAEFVVEQADEPHVLVLHSTTHVPAAWRERLGARIDWTWAFVLTDLPDGRTRVHLRVRGRTAPWWLTAGYVVALVPADHVMARGMLLGLRARAESDGTRGEPAATATTGPPRIR